MGSGYRSDAAIDDYSITPGGCSVPGKHGQHCWERAGLVVELRIPRFWVRIRLTEIQLLFLFTYH